MSNFGWYSVCIHGPLLAWLISLKWLFKSVSADRNCSRGAGRPRNATACTSSRNQRNLKQDGATPVSSHSPQAKMASMFIHYSFCRVGNCCCKLTDIFLSDFLLPGSCERAVNVETRIRVHTRACACAGSALRRSTVSQSEMPWLTSDSEHSLPPLALQSLCQED